MKPFKLKALLIGALFPGMALAAGAATGESDPMAFVIFWVTLIFSFAILGRYIARRLKQPGVLGELLMGVLVGNFCYWLGSPLFVVLREGSAVFNVLREMLDGTSLANAMSASIANPFYAGQVLDALSGPTGPDLLKVGYALDVFSRYGVIFLLFMVGLESSLQDLKRTGRESTMVAVIGVVAPIILGFVAAYWLLPEASYKTPLFIAATLSATSIGITARVLSELKQLRTREAQTILGAAMLDDILGLIILAIVSSVVIDGQVDFFTIAKVIISAGLYFVAVLSIGPWILRKSINLFKSFELWEAKLFVSFIFVMVLAWLATLFQLASIIGAFAAGLIIHDGYFETEEGGKKHRFDIKELVAPLEAILAPLFFMLIGIQVKLESFFDWKIVFMATALIIAAILGKLISGLGAPKSSDRWLIGIGMLPRGEVGLVFASIGRVLGVMNDEIFSAIILMVIVTTLIAPPLLKARVTQMQKVRANDH